MEQVVHNVAEIDTAVRQALEHLIGKRLAEHQQVIINVVNLDLSKPDKSAPSNSQKVPDWWNIYEGLTDKEIDELDQAIRQRANLTRVFE